MSRAIAALLAVVVLVTAACASGPPAAAPGSPSAESGPPSTPPSASPGVADGELVAVAEPRASTAPADAESAAAAINAFGFDLYRRVATGTANVVISPASIAVALGMARAGARGQTAVEMDGVLRDVATDEHAAWLNALDAALAARSGTFEDAAGERLDVILRIANAPFAQRGMPLEDAYLRALATRYGTGLRVVDYENATEEARSRINRWVAEQTEQRIPELLVPGVLSPDTRLTLVNAIYLKAPWRTPFAPEATKPSPFTRLDGTTVEVPMMALTTSLRRATGDGWRAVEVPYLGDALAMIVIVPDDLADFESTIDAARLDAIVTSLRSGSVALALPRFGIETKAGLAPVLSDLGMPTAFSELADFSGITRAERLAIAHVVHQANIDVDEKGTEAAAATAVVMNVTSAPPEGVAFRVDRPFVFALRDVATGAVLFLGRVTDPAVAGAE